MGEWEESGAHNDKPDLDGDCVLMRGEKVKLKVGGQKLPE